MALHCAELQKMSPSVDLSIHPPRDRAERILPSRPPCLIRAANHCRRAGRFVVQAMPVTAAGVRLAGIVRRRCCSR